jgi:hypothetical protein
MTEACAQKLLFPDDLLVSYANRILDDAGVRISVERVLDRGDRWIRFEAAGPRGGSMEVVAPTGTAKTGTLFFRSLLKVSRDARRPTWLINGQSGTGTSEIVFLGENGPWLATSLESVRAYFESNRDHIRADGVERFDAYVAERIRDVEEEGLVGDRPQLHRWKGGHEHSPLEASSPSP